MQINLPNDFEQATEEEKKIYHTLDVLIEVDIIMCKDNNVLLRSRLGDEIIGEYPIHCDIVNDEIIICKL